jgi:hypothetical protein
MIVTIKVSTRLNTFAKREKWILNKNLEVYEIGACTEISSIDFDYKFIKPSKFKCLQTMHS